MEQEMTFALWDSFFGPSIIVSGKENLWIGPFGLPNTCRPLVYFECRMWTLGALFDDRFCCFEFGQIMIFYLMVL